MRGIGLVTGESGSGKTCACRKVVTALHAGLYRVVYVSLSTGNLMDLYKTIAWEMVLPTERSRAALYRQIKNEVTRLCAEARCRPILIVDEAHNLRPDVLEDLRLLTNYQMDVVLAASIAVQVGKTSRENSAVQILVQLFGHELRQRAPAGLVGPLLLEGQQMLLQHLVERGFLRLPARVHRAGG